MHSEILSNMVVNNILGASTIYGEKGASSRRENRHCWALIVKFEGETVYTCGGWEYVSDINNVVILPMGCTYEWRCVEAGHFAVVEFACEETGDEILHFPNCDGERVLTVIRDMEFRRIVRKPMYQQECMRDLYSLLITLAKLGDKKYHSADKRERLAKVMEYIANNYSKTITNDTLAGIAGMSTVYFRKLFTQIYGTSPMAYVHNLRIKKAKEMLSSDYGSITDVAYSLGYASVYDFSRDFKKHTGVPPSGY